MIPKIHAKGASFKGCAQYILHDKEASTSERVEWTETMNLSTNNPHAAWRVMAAVSMDQDNIKREAGGFMGGKKSKAHVAHFSLNWKEEEAKSLTRDEQMRAVKSILRVMKAKDHQVLVVCHNDEPQPHVHVMVNRVSTKDGKLLSDSYEKLKASQWAEKYEKERGKIYCHQRVINNAARKRGEYVRGKKDTARHVYEAAQKVANDNSKKKSLLEQHRRKAAAIAKKDRLDKARHKKEFQALQEKRKQQIIKLKEQVKTAIERDKQKIKDAYRPKWEKQHFEQQANLKAFEQNEKTLKGRMHNALKLVEWRKLIGRQPGEKTTLSNAFKIFSKEGDRRAALDRQFKKQDRDLQKTQDAKVKAAAEKAKQHETKKLDATRKQFTQSRNDLILKHRLERAKTKTQWQTHDKKQREAWKELRKEAPVSGGKLSARTQQLKDQAGNAMPQTNSADRSNDDRER